MTPPSRTSRRTRNESMILLVTLSLASLCCAVSAEVPSASSSGVAEGTQHASTHEHFLQEFSDFEDDEDTAFDMISTESELPDVTSLGLHDIQHRFQTLVHGVDDEEEDDAKDRSGTSAGGERGLKPKVTKAEARAIKAQQQRAKQAAKAAKNANKANKKADKKADKEAKKALKNKGKKVTTPAPIVPAPTPTVPAPTPTARPPFSAPHSAPSAIRSPGGKRRLNKRRKYL